MKLRGNQCMKKYPVGPDNMSLENYGREVEDYNRN